MKAKLTVSPITGLLPASTIYAERVELPPRLTVVGAALSTTVLAAPAVKLTLVLDEKPPALPVTVAVSTLAPAVSVTWAIPTLSVVADAADRVPADAAKVTLTPEITAPA